MTAGAGDDRVVESQTFWVKIFNFFGKKKKNNYLPTGLGIHWVRKFPKKRFL